MAIRIVYCLDNLDVGGTELNAVRIAERLDRHRFNLSFACFRTEGTLAPRLARAGITLLAYPISSLVGTSAVREGIRFASLLRRERVDVVHAHDRYSNAFAVPWARLAGTRAVIASKRWMEIEPRHRAANRLAYWLAHRVLANSGAVGASLTRYDRVPAHKVSVVPNFVDEEAFVAPSAAWLATMREELAIDSDSLVVGVVANLRPVKDHATLFHACAVLMPRRPTVVLVLFGSGPEEASLRTLAAELGIAHAVRFAGTRANVPNLHALFDVSVLPSRSEGFPNSLVEAMAAGRAVVATSVGGVADAVADHSTGLLVPAGDANALAAAISRLLDEPSLRRVMGEEGRAHAIRRFSAASIIPEIERLYAGMTGVAGE
jgi:glycosyltransferase involved in cell wall biosynthesis